MSAWTVSKAHIDVLVQAMIDEQVIDPEQATAIGATLWRENYRSVNYRYRRHDPVPRYTFRGIEAPLDPAVVVKSAACYHYQCAEFQGWADEHGARLVKELADRIGRKAGVDDPDLLWQRADETGRRLPWGIEDSREAIDHSAMGVQR